MSKHSTSHLRQEYVKSELLEADLEPNPFDLFKAWFQNAQDKMKLPDAAVLSTVSVEGTPESRVLLIKEYGHDGFVFFTNKDSKKGQELKFRPHASLLFWWPETEQQIRITGPVSETPEEESSTYFASRPRASQLAAWASKQSEVLDGRKELEHRLEKYEKEFENKEVERPKHWGGYRLAPDKFEFWQGRASRLHDRFCYEKTLTGDWVISRLNP